MNRSSYKGNTKHIVYNRVLELLKQASPMFDTSSTFEHKVPLEDLEPASQTEDSKSISPIY